MCGPPCPENFLSGGVQIGEVISPNMSSMLNLVGKKEYEMVKETAKMYQHILRYSLDGFLLVSKSGKILDVNEAYCRLLKYTRKEMLRMNVMDLQVSHEPERIKKLIEKIVKRGSDRFLTRHRDKNGVPVEVEVSAHYCAHYSDGLIVAFLRDIRDRRKTERLLEKTRRNSKRQIEQLLMESYKNAGIVNRKITLLKELERCPQPGMDKDYVVDYVLRMAMKVSGAVTGYLYSTVGQGKYHLLACRGTSKSQCSLLTDISSRRVKMLKSLNKSKNRLNGEIRRYQGDLFALNKKLDYFVTLPIIQDSRLRGFIFLGFGSVSSFDKQEFDFLDIFALHASGALHRSGVL